VGHFFRWSDSHRIHRLEQINATVVAAYVGWAARSSLSSARASPRDSGQGRERARGSISSGRHSTPHVWNS
jgi:hypothetical protein